MPAAIYLSLHGTYSVLWLLKERMFPDKRFDEPVPAWIGLLFIFVPLAGYWTAPFLLISRHLVVSPALASAAISINIAGVFLHYVSDAQKFYTLSLQKGLIAEGLFARTSNPNYLGEILIYFSFALLAQHWLPFVILAAWALGYSLRNMRAKDRSISRYPGFTSYKLRSGLLLPKLRGRGAASDIQSGQTIL